MMGGGGCGGEAAVEAEGGEFLADVRGEVGEAVAAGGVVFDDV